MKDIFNHLVQRHVIPVLLIPVVLSGWFCFAISGLPQAIRTSSTTDTIILTVISLLGVIGTFCTWVLLRVVRSQPTTWQIIGLGRTAWSVLIVVAWLGGAACGVLMIYQTSQL